jgi:hypothetical protein
MTRRPRIIPRLVDYLVDHLVSRPVSRAVVVAGALFATLTSAVARADAGGASPSTSVDDALGALLTYGPVIGGMYVLYAVASFLLARYRSSSWLAQGKRLAISTGALGVLGAALQAELAGSPWTLVLAAVVAAAFKLLTPTVSQSPTALRTAKVDAALVSVLAIWIGATTLPSCGGARAEEIKQAAYACATVDVGRTVPEVGMTILQDVMAIVEAGADGWRDALLAIGVKYGEDSLACAAKAAYDALTRRQSDDGLAASSASDPTGTDEPRIAPV